MVLMFLIALMGANNSYLVSHQSGTFTPPYLAEYDYVAIGEYYFNPKEKLPEIPAELTGESDYYLIHLKGPVYEDMKKTIESYGVKLIQYIPFNAFIAKMDKGKKTVIEGLSFINWIGNYEPAYKISTLFKELPNEKEWLVLPFPDENIYLLKNKIEKLGCEILEVSDDPYCRVLKIRSEQTNLNLIARMPEVMYIEPYLQPVAYNQSGQWVTQTWKQVDRKVWRKGLLGTGQVVNTADTGILTSHDMFRDPAVPINTWGNYPTHRKIIAYLLPTGSGAAFGDVAGGSWHGTHTAGTICGDDSYVNGTSPHDGMPLKAKMFFMDIGTSTGSLSVPSNLANLYLPPYNGNAGGAARISSHSWGSTSGAGTYPTDCQQTDQFMWTNRDFLICYAAGNSGPNPGTVLPPGTSKNILTVGATMNHTAAVTMADFSSRGPTADNRIKPTVTAPGYFLYSSVGPNNNSYLGMAGTSMATPCVAGNATLVREYFAKGFYPSGDSNPANAWSFIPASLVKAIIINGAHPQITGSTIPDNNTGWGRVCIDDALFFNGDVRKLWVTYDSVSTGQYDEFTVTVNNQSEPLKITLVWTDYPATAGATVTLVNNLDLRVTSPNGTVYLGNVYSGGQSAPGGSADARNVEECVRRNVPEIGNWVIRVTGTSVPQGTNQPYAVVVSGGLGPTTSPVLHIAGQRVYDPPPNGNFNGRCDAGETVQLVDTLRNLSNVAVTGCVGVLRESSPYITLIDSVGNFGNIAVGGTGNNGGSPFRFSISSTTPPGTFIDMMLHLTGSGGYVQDIGFSLEIGVNEVHVVWGPKTVNVAPGDTHFLYGLGYNPQNDRIYVTNFYRRTTGVVMYSSDSNVTYLGYIPSPDSCPTDIKYCAYDNTFWIAADPNPTAPSKIIYKINTSGTILRQFANPANDYPTGLAWVPTSRWIYTADRRSAAGSPPIIYRCDTLGGNVSSYNLTIGDNYGPRGLAIEPYGPDTTLLLVYTHFSSDATPQLLKVALYELRRSDGAILNSLTLPGWNVRGVEYDPRDGNYWLTIAQNPNRSIVKILGFRGVPGVGVDEAGNPSPMEKITLSPGMPTPFSKNLKFSYSVPVKTRVKLALYDITGRLVKTFVNGEVEPGIKTIIWDGVADDNKVCASGVYLCHLETDQGSLVRKFVLAK